MYTLGAKVMTGAAAVVVTGGAWLVLIPWDMRNRPTYPGSITESTPLSVPAAAGFAVILLAVAGALGWLRWPAWLSAIVATSAPAALMMASFLTHPILDANIWPVAWVFFTAVMMAGSLLVALSAKALHGRRTAERAKNEH